MNNSLLLLFQQFDKFLFGADVAPDAPVNVVEVADDSGLFGERGKWKFRTAEFFIVDVLSLPNTCDEQRQVLNIWFRLEEPCKVAMKLRVQRVENRISRANDALLTCVLDSTLKRTKTDDEITYTNQLEKMEIF